MYGRNGLHVVLLLSGKASTINQHENRMAFGAAVTMVATRWNDRMVLLISECFFKIKCILNTDTDSNDWNIGVFPKCFTAFPEFSDKNICHYSKRAWTYHLLCKRLGYYRSASKTHVRDSVFKLSPIHASAICQIPWICWIQQKFCSIWENSNNNVGGHCSGSVTKLIDMIKRTWSDVAIWFKMRIYEILNSETIEEIKDRQ